MITGDNQIYRLVAASWVPLKPLTGTTFGLDFTLLSNAIC